MRHLFLFLLAGWLVSCSHNIINAKQYDYYPPAYIHDGIAVRDRNTYAIDTSRLDSLNKALVDEALYNVHSVLIYKDSALLFEKYLAGSDEKHGRSLGIVLHDSNTLHDIRSISKSVVSACIGIAIQKGLIKNEYEPIQHYFSCTDADPKGKITIRDLLTMSSGLSWKEIGQYNGLNDETRMALSFHPVAFVLKKALVAPPASTWNYSAGNTQLLAAIVEKVSGKTIFAFADENLFQPLGISSAEWINLTMRQEAAAASGLRLSSRSLLKFGILYLHHGRFNGQQLIDSNWVNKSLRPQIQRPDLRYLHLDNGGYGYQFWTYTFRVNEHPVQVTEAKGNGGQSVFICKPLHLVVVITAGNYGRSALNDIPVKILKDFVLPAIL